MIALIIYLMAGVALAWSYDQDSSLQRAAMVVAWPVLIGWGMSVQFLDWWRSRGYHYDDNEKSP